MMTLLVCSQKLGNIILGMEFFFFNFGNLKTMTSVLGLEVVSIVAVSQGHHVA